MFTHKLLHSLKKLWVLSQNCCVPPRNFMISRKTFVFVCTIIAFPRETLGSLTKYSLAKLLRYPKKLCDLLQNICIHLQNYWVTRETSDSLTKLQCSSKKLCDILCITFVFAYTFIAFPREMLLFFANVFFFFFHISYCVRHKGFCKGAQSFSGKCKSFVKEHIEIILFLPLIFSITICLQGP